MAYETPDSCGALATCTLPGCWPALVGLLLLCCWLFVGITVICDNHFVHALQLVRHRFNIPADVAGATLMGAGSSLTELFTSVTDALGTRNSIGFGTITGASIFNLLCNAGVAAVVVGGMQLDWQPFVRDASFYAVAVLLLLYIVSDGEISAIESAVLILGYVLYIVFMCFNELILTMLCGAHLGGGEPLLEDASLGEELTGEKMAMAEEGATLEAHSEALIEPDDSTTLATFGFMETRSWQLLAAPYTCLFGITLPQLPFDPSTSAGECSNLRLFTAFTISVMYIAALSAAMTWTATAIGCVSKLDSAVVGVTLVATGTSLSGIISSAIVAKQGFSNMAVANALGSNVFCIFIGLGLPWFISGVAHERPFIIADVTQDVIFEAILVIFGTLIGVVCMLWYNKWYFSTPIGLMMLLWYIIFVVYVFLKQVVDVF